MHPVEVSDWPQPHWWRRRVRSDLDPEVL